MTVRELLDLLADMPPDFAVEFYDFDQGPQPVAWVEAHDDQEVVLLKD